MIKQLLASCARLRDMDCGIETLFNQRPIEMQLHVSGAFEFLENDLIHPAAGIDQRGCENGEAASFLDITSRAKKFLWLEQRLCLHAAGHDAAFARLQ